MNWAGLLSDDWKWNVSLNIETFSAATPACTKRSTTCVSTPQVIGLTKPGGGGGVNAELILSTCETNVESFGIQLPITIRPPGLVTRTISLATSSGLDANIAPKTERVKSNERSATPSRLLASPSRNVTRSMPAS